MANKNKVQDYLMDYLQKIIPNFKTNKKLFTCPVCKEVSANIFPPDSGKIHCFTPNCGKVGTIIDVCRMLEFDNCEDIPVKDIEKHLIKMFDIKTIEHTYEIFDEYIKWGWDLVPVEKNRKESWIENDWQLKSHKDKTEWIEWAKSINMGVKTGKMSNVLGIDFDFVESVLKKKIYTGKGSIQDIELANKQHSDGLELVKLEMPYLDWTTVQQSTFGGVHLFYIYDEEVPKTAFNFKGIHIDIESEGGQIVVEPSIVGGQKRTISGKGVKPLPKELKDLIINNCGKNKNEEKIEYVAEDTELTFANLNGDRNRTFMGLYGELRKIMTVKKAFIVLQKFNGLLDKKVPVKELKAMANQAEKHTKCDLDSLYDEIKEHFARHNEASTQDLKACIDAEPKDVKEVLARLIDDDKIYKQRSMYKNIEKADWKTEFIKESKILDFPVPYFDKYATFRRGDMVCVGAETGVGKSYISLNIIRQLVEWGIKPKGGIRYLSSEPGNRFAKIAIEMGLKEGDFYFFNHYNPEQIELEDDAVTIIDWLLPEDFSQTANLYKIFSKQLDKHGGLCFIFSQLREDKNFYASQMVKMYASVACKYFYSELNGIKDNVNTYFQTEKIRESKSNQQYLKIATKFENKKLELK